MKKAIILHCWYGTPEQHWYPWLKAELEAKGYTVFVPNLPTSNTNLPSLDEMIATVEAIGIDEETVLIGHSLGCLLAMRLAEKYMYNKMILVAGWDFNDLTSEHKLFWTDALNHEIIISNTKQRVCVTSDNDPYFTKFTTEEMSKRLTATCIVVAHAGHFTDEFGVKSIPELLSHV